MTSHSRATTAYERLAPGHGQPGRSGPPGNGNAQGTGYGDWQAGVGPGEARALTTRCRNGLAAQNGSQWRT